ncbi:MAG TPA: tetratricopeptide repeat protein [Terriglobia bacterium]|nr:tetratricopeptide repeat protein [Terriglobia bacterium]
MIGRAFTVRWLFVMIACFVSPVLLRPDDWTVKVRELIRRKELATAEKLVVEKLVSSPRNPQLITFLAEVRFDQRRYQEASQLIKSADGLAGPSVERATLAGLVAVVQGRLDAAEPKFRESIRLDPGFAPAHYYLSRLLYTQNHFDEAIRESKTTIALSPDFVRAYENLGLCHEGKQEFAEAEKWYKEAIRRGEALGQISEWPYLDLAAMLIRNGRDKEARPYLVKALAANSRNPESHFQMGYLLEKEGDLSGAVRELELASELDPAKPEPYYREARIYQRLGKTELAKKYFDAFRKTSEAQHKPAQRSPEEFSH